MRCKAKHSRHVSNPRIKCSRGKRQNDVAFLAESVILKQGSFPKQREKILEVLDMKEISGAVKRQQMARRNWLDGGRPCSMPLIFAGRKLVNLSGPT
jgi:hypothetical protein